MYIADIIFQLKNIAYGLGLGFALGILYQFVRVLYAVFPKSKLTVFFADFFFIVISALSLFILLVAVDNGHFRFYIIFAVLLGFAVSIFTAGEQLFSFVVKIFTAIKKIVSLIFKPFVKIFKKILKSVKKIKNKLKKLLKRKDKVLYNNKE